MTVQSIKKVVPGAVFYPCMIAVITVCLIIIESIIWRLDDNYPAWLTQARYVNDRALLTSDAIKSICARPLITPELVLKNNGLFLRCGIPGLEGVYRIEHY